MITFTGIALGLSLGLLCKTLVPRVPLWGAAVIALGACVTVPPLTGVLHETLREIPVLARITGLAVMLGVWAMLASLTIFERKGAPRRVPIWGGMAIGMAVTLGVPPLLNVMTGRYQDTSLHSDVTACASGLLGQTGARNITNTCPHPIVIGLCLPPQRNPAPCTYVLRLAPSEVKRFDPMGTAMAARPGFEAGATVIACRPPHRPSRGKAVGGRGYRGICLPAAPAL